MMDSQAVAIGIEHAHSAGKSRGKNQGAVIVGTGCLVLGIGLVFFLNQKAKTEKENAVYHAESKAFSHGVGVAREEIAHAQMQASKALIV